MSETAIRDYLRGIEAAYRSGNATEHTYRSYLKQVLETLFPGTTATNEPKRVACGAPDFIVTNNQTPLGYIETKDIGVSLDKIEHTDQMKRYLGSLTNLILTDYVEFRWYSAGNHTLTARLLKAGAKGKFLPDADGIEQVSHLLHAFMTSRVQIGSTPKELATRMASIAQLIRNAITLSFKSENNSEHDGASQHSEGTLHTQMQGFRQVLLPDLNPEQFADMYAQSICYGLFAARCNAKEGTTFTREHAAFDIPKTNPFLRKMFAYIAGPDLDERIAWAVDDLAEVLNRADMEAILRDFGRRTRQEDPIVHFYETFLAAYDPKMREARGVYYTPEPVVSYIVRSVDSLLKQDFGLPDGLADATKLTETSADGTFSIETHKVQILDPATGTGTFLHSVIDHIYETFNGNRGMWSSYVSAHLLPRLFGFELLMAPYAVAHMKLGLQLRETGYDFRSNERLGVYLTNTLEEGFEGGKLPFAEWIVEEATAAGNVKYDAPVMVVVGNPPYSISSQNIGDWIEKLVKDYYIVDGQSLNERNPKGLQDDYVKFIRFAQWRIEQTGYGILAFITNHGYLDNPTFRGMRQSLILSFDEIYLLDLHGNSNKKERSPDGSKDENVFDIQQGVAIGIFIKQGQRSSGKLPTKVYHAHLWGQREMLTGVGTEQHLTGGKYYWLANHDITSTEWEKVEPQSPFYLFIPQISEFLTEYQQGTKMTDIFSVHSSCLNTLHDDFVISFDKTALKAMLRDVVNKDLSDKEFREKYNVVDSRDWKLSICRVEAMRVGLHQLMDKITQCLYRPFDQRWVILNDIFVGYPRWETTRHFLLPGNIGLVTTRQSLQTISLWASEIPLSQHKIVDPYHRSYIFPLYLYPDPHKNALFDTDTATTAPGGRRPNLSPAFIADYSNRLKMRFVEDGRGDLREAFGPEDVFNYMYAVFHAPTYRTRYAEFLKIDFPRLPLTSDVALFRELCTLGVRLVGLHLMEQFGHALPTYPVDGNNMVEKVEFLVQDTAQQQGRVYINKTQYVDSVPQHVWEFHVGGYQVCQKWLKDRKGRVLSYEDIRHYQRIVAALAETITIMEQIDAEIDEHGGWPIA
jgi:predicted helicase